MPVSAVVGLLEDVMRDTGDVERRLRGLRAASHGAGSGGRLPGRSARDRKLNLVHRYSRGRGGWTIADGDRC